MALAQPRPLTNLVGTILVLVGVVLRVWAAGVLSKGEGLCTVGPYRYIRHPLYLGSLLAALGFCVMMNVIWAWVVVLPVFAIIYAYQIVTEERFLLRKYGKQHLEWVQQVPLLIPIPWRRGASSDNHDKWRWSQALANREHYHMLVTVALVTLFYLKYFWQVR